MEKITLISTLMEHRGKCFHQERFLLRKYRAKVEYEALVLNARDHGYAGGRTAQPLLELCRRVSCAGNSNHFRRQRLPRSGTAARKRNSVRDFDLHFVEWEFRPKLANKVLRPALQFLRCHSNHAHRRNF